MEDLISKIKAQLLKLIGGLPTNVGTIDRIVRIAVGILLLLVALAGVPWAKWAYWIGPLLILTAVLRSCPIYAWLGKSTYTPPEED